MRELRYGEMLFFDSRETGPGLYMVVNPPIECEHCGERLIDWSLDDENHLYCPRCEGEILEFKKVPCPYCREMDYVTLSVACNNNFHVGDDEIVPYCDMQNHAQAYCLKSIWRDIESGGLRLLSHNEAVLRKRNLIWTSLDSYDPSKKMPQWIIDRFPLE